MFRGSSLSQSLRSMLKGDLLFQRNHDFDWPFPIVFFMSFDYFFSSFAFYFLCWLVGPPRGGGPALAGAAGGAPMSLSRNVSTSWRFS